MHYGVWSHEPQRSCLGNKTEAAGRIKGPSQGMILTRHETLSAAGHTFCLLNQGFYHQTLVTSREVSREISLFPRFSALSRHTTMGVSSSITRLWPIHDTGRPEVPSWPSVATRIESSSRAMI